MRIINIDDSTKIKKLDNNLCLCIGAFKTLHLGHQALIKEACTNLSRPVGVISFVPSPHELFRGEADKLVLSEGDKGRILSSLGVSFQINVKFDQNLANMSAVSFIEKVLLPLGTKEIYVGEDFHFGKDNLGDISTLKEYFNVHPVEMVLDAEGKLSSSRVYSLIKEGKVDEVSKILGRFYEVSGTVIHGKGEGKKLNFPTANLAFDAPYLLPENGVYLVRVFVRGEPHFAMANVGVHPTINELDIPILEVHILDFALQIYDWRLYVQFLKKIRPEYKFHSTDELSAQLEEDKAKIRDVISKEIF